MTNQDRKELADNYPLHGNARAKDNSAFLGIGLSTFWKYVAEGRIKKPTRYGNRVSVWDCSYIRELAQDGIPDAKGGLT